MDKSKEKTLIKNGLIIEIMDFKNSTKVRISQPGTNSKRVYYIDHSRRKSSTQFDNLVKTVDSVGGDPNSLFSLLEGMGFQKETW